MSIPDRDWHASRSAAEQTAPHRDRPGTTRRKYLLTFGGVATLSLAGCLSGRPSASADEPVDPSPDAACGLCQMAPAEYPDWNAQVVLEDGTRTHFCSPGCFTSYYVDPGRFAEGREREDIAAAWVTDYASKEWTDAMSASYVLETSAKRIDAPMMKNPVPFTETADARSYVAQYDDLGPGDIVGLDAFDRAIARSYRPNAFS